MRTIKQFLLFLLVIALVATPLCSCNILQKNPSPSETEATTTTATAPSTRPTTAATVPSTSCNQGTTDTTGVIDGILDDVTGNSNTPTTGTGRIGGMNRG